jgi:2-polyprenyl-3-methyl-5-hydroxy-6-metoxy-1,4-benzoquinol methylase
MDQSPSPELFFSTVFAFQRTFALKGAIDLNLFTVIGEGHTTAKAIADRCQTSERGTRILCDVMTIDGFLTKQGDTYALTRDSAVFLDQRSPAYLGSVTRFLNDSMLMDSHRDVAAIVRKGGTVQAEESVSPENPAWVTFARAMMPMMMMPAQTLASIVAVDPNRTVKLLDIAAGHGIFGIVFAQTHPNAEVTALDWAPVLQVASENAQKFGVEDRYHLLPGSAFDVEFGSGYDLVLLTNFLHHFDAATNETLLRKVHAALGPGGRAVTLEFIPNDDRVTPPMQAGFALTMLASTAAGDAYTFAQLQRMFANAGFARSEMHEVPPTQRAVVSYK